MRKLHCHVSMFGFFLLTKYHNSHLVYRPIIGYTTTYFDHQKISWFFCYFENFFLGLRLELSPRTQKWWIQIPANPCCLYIQNRKVRPGPRKYKAKPYCVKFPKSRGGRGVVTFQHSTPWIHCVMAPGLVDQFRSLLTREPTRWHRLRLLRVTQTNGENNAMVLLP